MSAIYEKGKIHFDKICIFSTTLPGRWIRSAEPTIELKRDAWDCHETVLWNMTFISFLGDTQSQLLPFHFSYRCTHIPERDPGEGQRWNGSMKTYNEVTNKI